ncbi:hypothetical protein GIB67_023095, partial [Kingdonia uniflora]
MVKTRSMVLEERIRSEMQRLKLKYFGDRSLEMVIPAPVPPTYQGLSGEEAAEVEEDFYYKWRFHVLVWIGEESWACFCTLAEDRVRGSYAGKGVKSTVERKKSLLDEVTEEETELELVLGELSLSRKKRVESKLKKVVKAQFTRSMTGVDEGKGKQMERRFELRLLGGEVTQGKRKRVEPLGGSGEKVTEGRSVLVDNLKEVKERDRLVILQGKEDTSQMVVRLVKGIWLGIEEQESELKKAKSELEKNLALAKSDALKEVKQLKAVHAMAIGQLQVEAKVNLDVTAKECDRLGLHLMLKGYSQEEVDAIKADTYAEEEEEAEVLGVVDGLDGVSPQTVPDNQGDDVELPEGGSEK